MLRRVAEALLAGGPGPEAELADPGPPAHNGNPRWASGAEGRALNLSLIIEENGHVTALSKLRRGSGSRQADSAGC